MGPRASQDLRLWLLVFLSSRQMAKLNRTNYQALLLIICANMLTNRFLQVNIMLKSHANRSVINRTSFLISQGIRKAFTLIPGGNSFTPGDT